MKKLRVLLALTLLSCVSFADDQIASNTLFYQLGVDSSSVKIESYSEVSEDYFNVKLSFVILPANSCQENYAGLAVDEGQLNSYMVIYASPVNARCKMFARPRTVEHNIVLHVQEGAEQPLIINDVTYQVANRKGRLNLKN